MASKLALCGAVREQCQEHRLEHPQPGRDVRNHARHRSDQHHAEHRGVVDPAVEQQVHDTGDREPVQR
jgi:hypothetical protein